MESESTDALKNSGLKATLPRLKVLEAFRTSPQRHLTAEDVYRVLVGENADLGLATIYRVLTQFEQTALLKRSQLGSGRAVYELNDGEHHHGHIVCTRSGDVQEFFDPAIATRLEQIAQEHGFDLSDYAITLYGVRK